MELFLGQFTPEVSNIYDGIHYRCFSVFFSKYSKRKTKNILSCMGIVTTAIYLSCKNSKPRDNVDQQSGTCLNH